MQTESVREKYVSLLADVESLREQPLPEVREVIAEKVAIYFNKGLLDSSENNIACDIIRMLARDIELSVRKTLSYNLRNSIILPHDIVLRLANDVLEVSAPILEFSTALTDEDLLNIINTTNEIPKLITLSRRSDISPLISGELINTVHEDVVASLFLNNSSIISQASLEFAFNNFRNNSKVISALINRKDLSAGVVEQILNAVPTEVRNACNNKHIVDNTSKEVLGKAEDTLKTASTPPPSSQTKHLVNQLIREGLLKESLILRALCEGNMLFFEVSIARRAGIPVTNARTVIQNGNFAARRSLWRRAKMPESAFEAMDVVISFAVSNCNDKTTNSHYKQQLLEYIQEKGYEKTISLMPYVLALVASKVQIKDIV